MPKRKQSLGHATRNAKRMKSRAKYPDIQTRDVSPNKFSIQLHHQIIVHGYFRITIQHNLSIELTKYFQKE